VAPLSSGCSCAAIARCCAVGNSGVVDRDSRPSTGRRLRLRSIADLLPRLKPRDPVLVRADLNLPIDSGGVTDTNRVEAILPSLKALQRAGARIVLISHLGRPATVDPAFSTAVVASSLQQQLQSAVLHLPEIPAGAESIRQLDGLAPGGVMMLENLRFDPGEKANDADFARALATGCQYFVNDAFGCCHRSHASVDAVADLLPSYAGFLIEREIEVLTRIRDDAQRPFWIVAGGAKVRDKLGVLGHLSGQLDGIICGGGLANTLLEGNGVDVGASATEPEALSEVREVLLGGPELVLPVDFIAGDQLTRPTRTETVAVGSTPGEGMMLLDIGPETATLFCQKLEQARTIFWNGPLGVFETPEFRNGTATVAAFLAEHPGLVVVGGGDSAAAARQLGIADRFHHISTGGGAALEFLEGTELPGIAALERSATGGVT